MDKRIKQPFIIGVNGSPHKGHTRGLLELVLDEAEKHGAKVKIIDLANHRILLHPGKLNSKKFQDSIKDDMLKLQKDILKADGIIFASPTHWFNMSGLMKIFLDRLTSLEHFGFLLEGKIGGIIAYGPEGGALSNAVIMAMTVNQMGMLIPPYGIIFDEGRKDKWVKNDCRLLGKNIIQQIKVVGHINWGYPNEKYKTSPTELINRKKQ